MTAPKAFEQWKKGDRKYTLRIHDDGCVYYNSRIPIDQCGCDCYEKAIFSAGYRAAKGETSAKTGEH